jgi:predicted alpha/beta-fold hydrolase
MFLATMKPKALAKWQQHPGLFDRERLAAARTLFEFDDVFTAPLHGFRDTADYWARASAKPHLARMRIPALALNARNDPFVPAASLPRRPRWAASSRCGSRRTAATWAFRRALPRAMCSHAAGGVRLAGAR